MNPSIVYDHYITGLSQERDGMAKMRGLHQSERSYFSEQHQQQKKAEKTTSEPINFQMKRSDSEVELYESERMAEQRDCTMFLRIVNGMSAKPSKSPGREVSLANVIRTRHAFPNMSDSELKYNDHEQSGYQSVSTPVLSNVPDDIVYVRRASTEDMQYLSSKHYVEAAMRVSFGLGPDPMSDERSVDEIFDLDL